MASKIELYREVLAIEPNSKVFFPLARELSAQGQIDEALALLQRGIDFHPDHLEAKFLLIDILTRHGREGEAEAVFADVGSLLARYPSVWLLWSRAAADRSKDPSLAMLFLGHYFQNDSLTWSEVMERGLRSLTEAPAAAASWMPEEAETSAADVALADSASGDAPSSEDAPAPSTSAVTQADKAADAAVAPATDKPVAPATADMAPPPLRGAQEVMALADLLEDDSSPAPPARARSGISRRETPVRTRTMAALLASQGDVEGALEIYDALIATTPPGPEHEALVALADALVPEGTKVATPVTDAADEPTQAPGESSGAQPDAAKLVNMLEALAGRLEARSAG